MIKSRFADEDLYFKHQTLDDDDEKANPGPSDSLLRFFPIISNQPSCACQSILLWEGIDWPGNLSKFDIWR